MDELYLFRYAVKYMILSCDNDVHEERGLVLASGWSAAADKLSKYYEDSDSAMISILIEDTENYFCEGVMPYDADVFKSMDKTNAFLLAGLNEKDMNLDKEKDYTVNYEDCEEYLNQLDDVKG